MWLFGTASHSHSIRCATMSKTGKHIVRGSYPLDGWQLKRLTYAASRNLSSRLLIHRIPGHNTRFPTTNVKEKERGLRKHARGFQQHPDWMRLYPRCRLQCTPWCNEKLHRRK